MIYRSRVLVGMLLAVVLAGGLGLAVTQLFPSGAASTTATSTMTLTQASSSAATVTLTTTASATSTATSTEAATTTETTTATIITTLTSVATAASTSTATSVSSTSTVTSMTSSSIESSTTECEAPLFCGVVTAESPALDASNSSSGFSTLTFTLTNAGNLNLTDIDISLNNRTVATVRGVDAAQTVTYYIQLSPAFAISAGQAYQVEVSSSTAFGTGPTIEFSVTAAE